MKSQSSVRLDEMRGQTVYDLSGDKIGSVEEIYYNEYTTRPEWIGIGTGFFGNKRVLVPVDGGGLYQDGLMVAYDKDFVKDSPDVQGDVLTDREEIDLYSYYGVRPQMVEPTPERAVGDTTVTRGEEELSVGTRRVEVGKVRLRKWVETEPVALEIDLQRDVARVTRTPVDRTTTGRELGSDETEVTLSRDEPVVGKRTVEKERVTLEKGSETDTEQISDKLRKERVEVEDDRSA